MSTCEKTSFPWLRTEQQHRAGRVIEDKAGDVADGFWPRRMRWLARPQDAAGADDDEVTRQRRTQAHDLLFGLTTQHHPLDLIRARSASRPRFTECGLGGCHDLLSLLLLGLLRLREEVSAALPQAQVALAHPFHIVAGANIDDIEQHQPQIGSVEQGQCLLGQPLSIGTVKAA